RRAGTVASAPSGCRRRHRERADGALPSSQHARRPGLPVPCGDHRMPGGLRRRGGIQGCVDGRPAGAVAHRQGTARRFGDHGRGRERAREPEGMTMGTSHGKVICVGLGPGDPELMSVRADRLVRSAAHVAYFRKAGRAGQARQIVDGMLAPGANEYPMEYPVTTEIHFSDPEYNRQLAEFYEDWAQRLAELAGTGTVLVLCEGDPFFYGSFMHLHSRLQGRAEVEVVPGITGMSGCWTATGIPI